MKNLLVSVVFAISMFVVGVVSAQQGTIFVPDQNWTGQTGQCVTEMAEACRKDAGKATMSSYSTACVNVIQNCGGTISSAKSAGGPTYRWVKNQINRALKGMVSKQEFARVISALQNEIEAIRADLDRNWADHDVIRAEAKAQAEAQAVKDGEQDEEIAELKGRMDDAETGIEANRAVIVRLGKKVRFDLGAALVLSSDIMGAAGLVGLNFAITDIVRAKIHAGLGVSFNGEAMLVGQAGPEFLLGENKNFAIGLQALIVKEQMNDKGDTFIGAGPEFSFYFAEHGFLSLLGGLGTSTRLIDAPIPGYPMRTEREWDLAWAVMFQIGGTF